VHVKGIAKWALFFIILGELMYTSLMHVFDQPRAYWEKEVEAEIGGQLGLGDVAQDLTN